MKRNNEKSHCAKKHDKRKHGKAMATAKQEARWSKRKRNRRYLGCLRFRLSDKFYIECATQWYRHAAGWNRNEWVSPRRLRQWIFGWMWLWFGNLVIFRMDFPACDGRTTRTHIRPIHPLCNANTNRHTENRLCFGFCFCFLGSFTTVMDFLCFVGAAEGHTRNGVSPLPPNVCRVSHENYV